MLYTDDPVYAHYLISTFEMLWKQAVPAEERIKSCLSKALRRLTTSNIATQRCRIIYPLFQKGQVTPSCHVLI